MESATPVIVRAEVGPYPKSMWDMVMPKVTATFETGEVKELFSFYPDEINFSSDEFIGLTERQAHDLFSKKDIAYLRS